VPLLGRGSWVPIEHNVAWAGANLRSNHTTTTNVLRSFFQDNSGEPVPEENFWTLWCKGRLTEADTLTIRLGATPSRLTSSHLHHSSIPPYQVANLSIQPFNHNGHGPIIGGLCPFWETELGHHLTQCGPGRGLPPNQVVS